MRYLTLRQIIFLLMALTALGCQSNPAVTSVRYDNVRFMDVWSTYTHCLSADESQVALQDSTKLQDVSRAQTTRSSLDTILPAGLKNMVAQPSSRLAVDVHAMAASCGLHAGNLAMSAGELDVARHQFREVLHGHAESDYAYYTAQARERLTQLELTLQAALR
ncbi:MAG TPA: hypothetical protein PKW52_07255 [Nitrospira sp.]|nr:hypothetical protein [Nitrospira sp.]HQV11119.1 hypothetical protein [Nitrospira sp.]